MTEFYKLITTISLLLLISSCGSVEREDPYRPSGKSVEVVKKTKRKRDLNIRVRFLQERYNLCTHRRAINSAKYEYRMLVNREKKYGNKLTQEKNKYRRIIQEVGERSKIEEEKFRNTYNRRLRCTPEELRHLNL